jgi:hypothetical protein
MVLRTIIMTVFCSLATLEQNQDRPVLEPGDIPSGAVRDVGHFEGKALYGYIDGGADLYLEYGFRELSLQEVSVDSEKFSVEVYRMTDSLAAFGIFSISRSQYPPIDAFGGFSCASPYQVIFTRGPYFIRVVNATGSVAAARSSLSIARIIARKANRHDAPIPDVFCAEPLARWIRALRYIRGPLGLQNGLPEWEGLFAGVADYDLFVLPVDTRDGPVTLADVRCSRPEDAALLSERMEGGNSRSAGTAGEQNTIGIRLVRHLSPTRFLYLESTLTGENVEPFRRLIEDAR